MARAWGQPVKTNILHPRIEAAQEVSWSSGGYRLTKTPKVIENWHFRYSTPADPSRGYMPFSNRPPRSSLTRGSSLIVRICQMSGDVT